jgi:hypothetical protein
MQALVAIMGIIETPTIDNGPRLPGNRDDELLAPQFRRVSTGVYLPARVLLRGGGCG